MSIALADLSDWDSLPTAPGPAPEAAAVEVRTVFRGVVTSARILSFPESRRRTPLQNFTIGSDARVDAPVAADYVPWSSHPLVMAAGEGYVVNVTPQMTGRVRVRGKVHALTSFVRANGNTFALPASAVAQLDCGATSFIVTRTSPPRPLPPSPWRWDWSRHGYTLGTAALLATMLLVTAFVPSDPRALSLDVLGSENHFVNFLVKPPLAEEPQALPWLRGGSAAAASSGAASRAQARPGAMGDIAAPRRNTRFAVKGDQPQADPILARARAVEAIRSVGVLGVLRASTGGPMASIFGDDKALGSDASDVLGNLVGDEIAGAFGRDGLGVTGTGTGAAGTGDRLVGSGSPLTIGDRVGGGPGGSRRRWEVGSLHPRNATAPRWVPGDPQVRGGLDKEIVRRVIRLHLNEIKYCYEQELARTPALGGRLQVQFTIIPSGQVITSVLQSSTVGNPRVESCTVQAVRRWQFPQPAGGGLVTVSYPFVLAPSGG